MRIIDANLKYAQVVKHKERGHLREIEKRVIWGTEEEILEIIQQEGRGETINTSLGRPKMAKKTRFSCLECGPRHHIPVPLPVPTRFGGA